MPSDKEPFSFLCARRVVLTDGCVARCDKPHGHEKENDEMHVDSVIFVGWKDRDVHRRDGFTVGRLY